MTGLFDREGHLTELAAHRRLGGECRPDEVVAMDKHVTDCEECRARLDHLATLAREPLPPLRLSERTMLPGINRVPELRPRAPRVPVSVEPPADAATDETEVLPLASRRPSRTVVAALVGGLALAAGLALVLLAPSGRDAGGAPGGEETFTPRGAALRLEVFRDAGGRAERLGTGDAVAPGDRLGFRVADAEGGHLVVVGLDAAGSVYPVWPPDRSGSRPSAGAAEAVTLDAAVALDATPGAERLVAVRCAAPVAWADLASRLGEVAAAPTLPPLWPGCAQDEVRLEKASP